MMLNDKQKKNAPKKMPHYQPLQVLTSALKINQPNHLLLSIINPPINSLVGRLINYKLWDDKDIK